MLNRTDDNAGGSSEKRGRGTHRRKSVTRKIHKFDRVVNIFKEQKTIFESKIFFTYINKFLGFLRTK